MYISCLHTVVNNWYSSFIQIPLLSVLSVVYAHYESSSLIDGSGVKSHHMDSTPSFFLTYSQLIYIAWIPVTVFLPERLQSMEIPKHNNQYNLMKLYNDTSIIYRIAPFVALGVSVVTSIINILLLVDKRSAFWT